MTVHDVSYAHKRKRGQSTVDLLEKHRRSADEGVIVGVLVISVDRDGTWRHHRDMFTSDMPGLIGYLELCKANLIHRYLTGQPLTKEDDNPIFPPAG